MAKSVKALVEPELLVWARKSSGYSLEVVAKRISVKPERLESWETGKDKPTIKQLRKIGNVYKRPIAVFYLPTPPKDFAPMKDFRRLSRQIAGIESPQLRLEIRRAHDRRGIALELYEELEGELPIFSVKASLSDNPEDLAVKIRSSLGISYDNQLKFRNDYDALNRWRTALENIGVLTFQTTRVETSEMRGFSISDPPFPIIVLNNKDAVRGRIFTMLHEFVHIMLRDGGICDLGEYGLSPEKQRVEVFCNRVAGETLVPGNYLNQEDLVLKKIRGADWLDEEIVELADQYHVSREVILRRLLINGYTTNQFYKRKIKEYEKEYEVLEKKPRKGGPEQHVLAISRSGKSFVRLVLNNY
ncbi:MAG: XRE family transcriptional regulator, partial [Gemmatimonadota bacterium]|nr:XRE family transcriptional regulator [Gemmatimonadota bacterium]